MAFMAVGLLGAMPLALLVAGIVNGSAAGHAAWIWAGILLAVALTAVVLARFKRAMPLAVALVGAILLAEIPLVGQHHGLITAHWYWSLTAIVAMLFWVSGWFLAALDN
jgi:hypothetical protein